MENFLFYSKILFSNKIKKSSNSVNFWNHRHPTVSDMCGGFFDIHDYDIKSTELALQHLTNIGNIKSVLEVGSGIGRISTNLLYKYFENIDLLERKKEFLIKAKENCEILHKKIGRTIFKEFYISSIEDFTFQKTYDMIFIQWVLEYLTDEDLDKFLLQSYKNLNHQGVILIKENVSNPREYITEEGSHIRERSFFEERFKMLNLQEIYSEKVDLGRTDLFDVHCWCLKKI